MSIKVISKNKKASFNYEILDKIESGIMLTGAEVKSVKNGQINLTDAFVRIEKGEAWLWNAEIAPYKYADIKHYDSRRSRKLLLKRSQIDSLKGKIEQKGLTLVPTMVYLARGFVKVEVGLGKGRREFDKRKRIMKRERDIELLREKRKYMVK